MRNIVLCILRYLINSNSFLTIILLKFIALASGGRIKLKLVSTKWLDEYATESGGVLRPQATGFSVPPVFATKSSSDSIAVVFPDLEYRLFNSEIVSAASSAVLTRDELLLIERVGRGDVSAFDFSSDFILMHNACRAIVKDDTPLHIEKGIFFGGNGSFNYYHWLIEILPKCEFLKHLPEKYRNYPILVSKDVEDIASFKRSVDIFCGDRQVVFLEKNARYQVDQLIYIDAPNSLPFNMRAGESMAASQVLINPLSIEYVRRICLQDEIINSPSSSGLEYPEKVFLKRSSENRGYNQDDVEKMLERYSFVSVSMEELSFDEQIRTMHHAKWIVGPTGAAWTNIVFCRPGTLSVCWMAEELGDFSAFSNIASVVGMSLIYMTYQCGSVSSAIAYKKEYSVDIKSLEDILVRNEV